VGNDFERKGRFELLRACERKLSPEYRLTVVSNDPLLARIPLPENFRFVTGEHDPAHIVAIYREPDLLVLPTRPERYSNVVCELAAQGIPSRAARVGGVGELLEESGGFSL
jgi:glycosyltransferase involved in cell wall biosynthesis